MIGSIKSPVAGERFRKLSKKYADAEKQGNRTPNLRLEGDMLEALKFESTDDGIEVGVFGSEAQKADGHNKFTGRKNNTPKRRFIPTTKQTFKKSITSEIERIQRQYENASQSDTQEVPDILAGAATEVEATTLRDILGSSIFRDLLND